VDQPYGYGQGFGLAQHVIGELLKSSSLTDITFLSSLALDSCILGYSIERVPFCLRYAPFTY
jgi:hypothetical protein